MSEIRDPKSKSHAAVTASGSPLAKYQQVVVGSSSIWTTLYFEFCMCLAIIPGALGLFVRKLFWPKMFKQCGKGVLFAKDIIVRHPSKICLGNNVVVSERVVLDGRHESADVAIDIADDVIISNDAVFNAKGGRIIIGNNVGIGPQTVMQAVVESDIFIGPDCIIGPQCYFGAGASYYYDDTSLPIHKQGNRHDGGCYLVSNIWMGAKSTVLGDVRVEEGCIIAASAVVTKSSMAGDILVGIPAKAIKNRYQSSPENKVS